MAKERVIRKDHGKAKPIGTGPRLSFLVSQITNRKGIGKSNPLSKAVGRTKYGASRVAGKKA